MLPQEIRDIIKKEAEDKYKVTVANAKYLAGKRDGYIESATKYAELMIEFAEWVEKNFSHKKSGDYYVSYYALVLERFTTSDLLTIFLKEKSK